jgi:protein SCO1/2
MTGAAFVKRVAGMARQGPPQWWSGVLVALGVALAAGAGAQEPVDRGEVGIEERLDAQVPLDLKLLDESGQTVTLGSLIDRPTLLTLNYFRCAGICTPQLNDVAKLLGQIALRPGEDFRVLTVSFDERDTPEIAARKRDNYLKIIGRPVSPAAWHFLTGSAPATRALADAVGFRFKPHGDDFVHPAVLIVLSPQGRVMRYLNGVQYLPADVQMAVDDAGRGLSQPTIAKWVAFCYSYDPESRRKTLNITRVAGLATLLALGVFAAVVIFRGRGRGPDGGANA